MTNAKTALAANDNRTAARAIATAQQGIAGAKELVDAVEALSAAARDADAKLDDEITAARHDLAAAKDAATKLDAATPTPDDAPHKTDLEAAETALATAASAAAATPRDPVAALRLASAARQSSAQVLAALQQDTAEQARLGAAVAASLGAASREWDQADTFITTRLHGVGRPGQRPRRRARGTRSSNVGARHGPEGLAADAGRATQLAQEAYGLASDDFGQFDGQYRRSMLGHWRGDPRRHHRRDPLRRDARWRRMGRLIVGRTIRRRWRRLGRRAGRHSRRGLRRRGRRAAIAAAVAATEDRRRAFRHHTKEDMHGTDLDPRTDRSARPSQHQRDLDSAEDPEKMLDQLVRDFTNNIAEAEEATAQTIGNLRMVEDDAREARAASAEWLDKAKAASRRADELRAQGNTAEADRFDNLARIALRRQVSYESQAKTLETQVASADGARRQAQGRAEQAPRQARGAGPEARRAGQPGEDGPGPVPGPGVAQERLVMDPTSELARFEERIRRQEALVRGMEEVAASSLDEQFASLEATRTRPRSKRACRR